MLPGRERSGWDCIKFLKPWCFKYPFAELGWLSRRLKELHCCFLCSEKSIPNREKHSLSLWSLGTAAGIRKCKTVTRTTEPLNSATEIPNYRRAAVSPPSSQLFSLITPPAPVGRTVWRMRCHACSDSQIKGPAKPVPQLRVWRKSETLIKVSEKPNWYEDSIQKCIWGKQILF